MSRGKTKIKPVNISDLQYDKPRSTNFLQHQAAIISGLILSDIMALILSFSLALRFNQNKIFDTDLRVFGLFAIFYLIIAMRFNAYATETVKNGVLSISRAVYAILVSICAIALILTLLGVSYQRVTDIAPHYFMILLALTVSFRMIFSKIISAYYKETLFRKLLIIDDVEIDTPSDFRLINASDRGITPDPDDPLMRHWAALTIEGADYVLIACQPAKRQEWVRFLRGSNVRIEMLLPDPQPGTQSFPAPIDGYVCVDISGGFLTTNNRFFKRTFDILAAIIILVIFTPFILLCAMMVKYDGKGPVLFKQARVGHGNRLFTLYKFRTMTEVSTDNLGIISATRHDKRITRFGKFMRSTSLDELPQLFNVLKGDMSLVGPRPHAIGSQVRNKLFWEVGNDYWHRHAVKPGITGLAQIRGFRGSIAFESDLMDRLHSDLEYLQKWSFWRDLAIIFATTRVMVHKNAY